MPELIEPPIIRFDDFLNDAQRFIELILRHDFGVSSMANSVHQNFKSDLAEYQEAELPAIGVKCHKWENVEGNKVIDGAAEIVVIGEQEASENLLSRLCAAVEYALVNVPPQLPDIMWNSWHDVQGSSADFIELETLMKNVQKVICTSGKIIPIEDTRVFTIIGVINFQITTM